MKASEYVATLAALSRRDVRLRPRSLVGLVGARALRVDGQGRRRKAQQHRAQLARAEVSHRRQHARLHATRSRRSHWTPEADRDRFIDTGIRAAVTAVSQGPRLVHVFPAFATGGPEVRTCRADQRDAGVRPHDRVAQRRRAAGVRRLERQDAVDVRAWPATGGLGSLRKLGTRLAAQRPDLLVTYGWGGTDAILGARLAGLATPSSRRGRLPSRRGARSRNSRVCRSAASRSDSPRRLVVPSRTLERIAAASWWLPSRRVRYIPNGVDTDRFTPAGRSGSRRNAAPAVWRSRARSSSARSGMLRPDKNHAD